jgi:hypothetical protein
MLNDSLNLSQNASTASNISSFSDGLQQGAQVAASQYPNFADAAALQLNMWLNTHLFSAFLVGIILIVGIALFLYWQRRALVKALIIVLVTLVLFALVFVAFVGMGVIR